MRTVDLLVIVLSLTVSMDGARNCQETCNSALGVSDGRIENDKMTAHSLAGAAVPIPGGHNARLNKTDWPQGFRADGKQSPILIDVQLGKDKVITGLATQGYGDVTVRRWVTKYKVFYRRGDNVQDQLTDEGGKFMTFEGNWDSNTIKFTEVPVPVVTSSLTFLIGKDDFSSDGPGLRLELYGCEKGYHFVAFLLCYEDISLEIMDPEGGYYRRMSIQFLDKVNKYLESSRGFLKASLHKLGPKKSRHGITVLAAEVHILCIPSRVDDLIATLKAAIRTEEQMMYSKELYFQFPMSCSCRHKSINLHLAKSLSEADRVIITNESSVLNAAIGPSCQDEEYYRVTWEVFFVCPPSLRFTAIKDNLGNSKTLNVSGFNKYLSDAERSECYFFIRCVLTGRDPQLLLGTDYGYIIITKPALVARILGVSQLVQGVNSTIRLSANKSIDPSGGPLVNFQWFCRREDECFTKTSEHVQVALRNVEGGRGGCFGDGPGRLSSNESVLIINGDKMDGDVSYVFEVVVSKEGRNSTASHKVRVESPFQITVRCSGNCGKKLSTTRRIALKAECRGYFCHAIKRYGWTLEKMENRTVTERWSPVDHFDDMLQTPIDSPSLVIAGQEKSGGSLEQNSTYKATVAAYLNKDFAVKGYYTFLTNLSPKPLGKGSGCFVAPKEGEVLTTEFVMKCIGWHDPDGPLTYQFSVTSNDTGRFILQSGLSNVLRARFPSGSPESDHDLVVEVQISDPLGSSIVDTHVVKVRPSSMTDYTEPLKNVSSSLRSGGAETATQLAYCILSDISGETKEMPRERKGQVKEELLGHMTKINVQSIVRVSQMASLVDVATRQAQEVTTLSQEEALDLQSNAVSFISSDNSTLVADPGLVQQVATSILPGISNLQNAIKVTSQEDEYISLEEGRSGNSTLKKSATRILRTLQLVDNIGTVLLNTKIASERPTNLRLDSFNITLEKLRSSEMSHKSVRNALTRIILPSAAVLLDETDGENLDVGVQLVTFEENPYDWHGGSREIGSVVADFTLKKSSGQSLNLQHIREPVQLWMPLKSPKRNSKGRYFVKPSVSTENMQYHRINIRSNDVTVLVEIHPEREERLDVFVSALQRPTPDAYNVSVQLPDYSSCRRLAAGGGAWVCELNPYRFAFSSNQTGSIGPHLLAIKYNGSLSKANDRVGRSARLHKRSNCIKVKDPPTTLRPTVTVRPNYDSSTDLNYTISVKMATCKYWSENRSAWISDGCQVGMRSDVRTLQCLCTHLSTFGGNLFVEPNPIDFNTVFVEFGELENSGNVMVLITVCSCFILYIIGLILARHADRRDRMKVVANVYLHHTSIDVYEYQVQVQTGFWRGCGTTAKVGIILYGEEGRTDEISLANENSHKIMFSRGSVTNFVLRLRESLGTLIKVEIWHDDSGKKSSWFLEEIVIRDCQTDEKWHFLARKWLAYERGCQQVRVEIKAAKESEILSFQHVAYSRTVKSLLDEHLWLSIFTKPPHDLFSRCQRLSCCMMILYTDMLVNAMFYQFGESNSGQEVHVGPLKIDWQLVKIAIQSTVLTIPLNLLVLSIFRNTKPKTVDRLSEPGQEIKNGKLRHCFGIIGWVLCATVLVLAAAFTVFYSFLWGAEKANKWFVSALMSIALDVFITQPLRLVVIASLVAAVLRKIPAKDKVVGSTIWQSVPGSLCDVPQPGVSDLEKTRAYKTKMLRMSRAMKEGALVLFFIVLFTAFCYGNLTPSRYSLTKSVQDIFKKSPKENGSSAYWEWTERVLIPGLFNTTWYNGQAFQYDEGFISNREIFMIGMPRLRQVRTKQVNTCLALKREHELLKMFSRCLSSYSPGNEDTTPFYQPKWIPVTHFTDFNESQLLTFCPKPWRYRHSKELQTLPHAGRWAIYGGGGFVADLGYNAESAIKVLHDLKKQKWLDENTAAVLVEFALFEPSTSRFSSVRHIYERFQTGGASSRSVIQTTTLYGVTDRDVQATLDIIELLLVVLLVFFTFKESVTIFHRGLAYFKQFWNWVELVQICSAMSAICVFFVKDSRATSYVKKVRSNPYETSSIDYVIFLADLEVYLISLAMFTVTLKLLRILRYSRHVSEMMGTLKTASKPLAAYIVFYVVAVIPYSQLGHLMFGSSTRAYSTFPTSLSELFSVVIDGRMEYLELRQSHQLLGPMYILFYLFGVNILFINMSTTILLDCKQQVGIHVKRDNFDAEIGEFMMNYVFDHGRLLMNNLRGAIASILRQKPLFGVVRRNALRRRILNLTKRRDATNDSEQHCKKYHDLPQHDGQLEYDLSSSNYETLQINCDDAGDDFDYSSLVDDDYVHEIRSSILDISRNLRRTASFPCSNVRCMDHQHALGDVVCPVRSKKYRVSLISYEGDSV